MKIRYTLIIFFGVFIGGCGGGGGSSSSGSVNPVQSTPGFDTGEFLGSNTYQFSCQMPRTGINPETGQAYLDVQGSTEDENNWLRSWSNELYFWYDEIIDRNPAQYNDTELYFDILKTIATTPSGNPRDQFHFTYDTDDWIQLSQSGVSSGYGADFVLVSASLPREVIVSLVEPGSPAFDAGLRRGTEILFVDGVSVVSGGTATDVDVLNAGLFPEDIGESHNFEVRHLGNANNASVTLVSAEVTTSPVLLTDVLPTTTEDVGYIVFNSHIATAEAELITAIEQLQAANVSDLVLDLRYNGGGYLAIAAQMAYMIAGPALTQNKIFETQVFNDKYSTVNPVTGNPIEPLPFIGETLGFSTTAGQTLPSLDLNRVFILTGSGTCSASEAVINGLRGANIEVIQIGTTTCGKPYGFYPKDNCGTTYFSIQFSGTNDIGFGDYPDGFSPQNTLGNTGQLIAGCSVADDYYQSLGNPLEGVLAAALQYRLTSSCPTPPQPTSSALSSLFSEPDPFTMSQSLKLPQQMLLQQNKIMGIPR